MPSLDLGGLTSSAHKQVDKLSPKGDEERAKPQIEVLESVIIIVAVVCLALAAEYVVTSLLVMVALVSPPHAAADAAARTAASLLAVNSSVQELNASATALGRTVADLRQQNALLAAAVVQLAALSRDLLGKQRRRITVVCDAAPARMHELHSNSKERETKWMCVCKLLLFLRAARRHPSNCPSSIHPSSIHPSNRAGDFDASVSGFPSPGQRK